jgi:hypothetical protein
VRAPTALAAVLAAVALSACGDSGGSVPQGNPDGRHGAEAVDAYAQVELLRALIVASSDSYYAGGSAEDAGTQLERAQAAYGQLAARVRRADPVLDREVVARFRVVARALREGTPPDHYRDLATPLWDQLMDGVSQALVAAGARSDPGVRGEALRRVALRLSATYDASASSSDADQARLAFEESWGLWRRALALVTLVKPALGDQKDRIAGAMNSLRGPAFPEGPLQPERPAALKVDQASVRVVQALDKRFGLSEA